MSDPVGTVDNTYVNCPHDCGWGDACSGEYPHGAHVVDGIVEQVPTDAVCKQCGCKGEIVKRQVSAADTGMLWIVRYNKPRTKPAAPVAAKEES